MHRIPALAAIFILALGSAARAAEAPDPFLWLEDVTAPRAMAWVQAENAKTVGVLEGDHRFAGLNADALKIAEATDRIPEPELIGDQVYNFWRDDTHVRGVWRRTSKADYAGADPHWTTVLDLDQLAASEHANWVWEGANCPPPSYRRCMISLSDGGEDATTEREFDLSTKAFVPAGFVLPHSKQTVDWLDDDTLIISRDWGPGTMTASGYPFVVKTLKRGQTLDQAFEVFRGSPADVSVDPLGAARWRWPRGRPDRARNRLLPLRDPPVGRRLWNRPGSQAVQRPCGSPCRTRSPSTACLAAG